MASEAVHPGASGPRDLSPTEWPQGAGAGGSGGGGAVRLLLASRSPRRRDLLHEHGLAHEVIDGGVDDGCLRPPAGVRAEAWVAALAWLKARAGAEAWRQADAGARGPVVVLGADTLCVVGAGGGRRRLLGQPRDAGHALSILRCLVGGTHEVLTGVAMVCPETGARDVFVDRSMVRWGAVGEEALAAYAAGGGWRGKAGGYNLRERLEAGWPIEHEGDRTSIMGLPMGRLVDRLARFFVTGGGA